MASWRRLAAKRRINRATIEPQSYMSRTDACVAPPHDDCKNLTLEISTSVPYPFTSPPLPHGDKSSFSNTVIQWYRSVRRTARLAVHGKPNWLIFIGSLPSLTGYKLHLLLKRSQLQRNWCITHAKMLQLQLSHECLQAHMLQSVASPAMGLWGTCPPQLPTLSFLVHFRANLTANYPRIL